MPSDRVPRPILFGKFDLESERIFYLFMLLLLMSSSRVIRSLRTSRAGRALVAARDNPRAAQAYGVNLTKIRLFGFALSGFIAALAGAAFMFHQRTFAGPSSRRNSTSRSSAWRSSADWDRSPASSSAAAYFSVLDFLVASARAQLFTSGFGLLLILLVFPGGLGQIIYDIRDAILRKIARTAEPRRVEPARRRREGDESEPPPEVSTTAVPIGSSALSKLREFAREWKPSSITGGAPFFPLFVLFGLNAVDELDRTAFAVLTPEIHDHFRLDIQGILTLVTLTAFLSPVPRRHARVLRRPQEARAHRRLRRSNVGTVLVLTGFAPIVADARRSPACSPVIGREVNLPTHNSLIADYYDVSVEAQGVRVPSHRQRPSGR